MRPLRFLRRLYHRVLAAWWGRRAAREHIRSCRHAWEARVARDIEADHRAAILNG